MYMLYIYIYMYNITYIMYNCMSTLTIHGNQMVSDRFIVY